MRNRFLVFLLVFAGAPVIALSFLTYTFLSSAYRKDIGASEQQFLNQNVEKVNTFFNDAVSLLKLRVGFVEKTEISVADQEFLLDGFLRENDALEEVSFINLQGRETSKKSQSAGKENTPLRDVSNLPSYLAPLSGNDFIGTVEYGQGGLFVTLSSPVRNRNGNTIQILSGRLNLSTLVNTVLTARLGGEGYLALADEQGRLIAQGGRIPLESGIDANGIPRVASVLAGAAFDGFQNTDRYFSQFGKVSVVGAGKKIPLTGWAMLVEWPLEDANSALYKIRSQGIQTLLYTILAIFLIVPFLVERLVAPIRELQAGAAEVEKGNFERKVIIQTNDELEDLGNSFNKMVQGLKRLRELQNEFVFIASHELRTPLTAIRWYISEFMTVQKAALSAAGKQYIQRIGEAAEHLSLLVDEILTIARAEAGRLEIKGEPVDVVKSVRLVIQELTPLAKEKRITMSYAPPADVPLVFSQSLRVEEIARNLLSNAIKYSDEKKNITISHEQNGQFLVTHIQDQGKGIDPKEQQHIFEKFFRASAAKKDSVPGTGLGLFIVKELVERMQGKIWFSSELGKGSVFSFSLPIAP
ncbi:MAG: sensor histidine kinase [Candidatus Wildermuthbacteria bacterium]|nr:sensor histidine kinase [Candidatus Wildermuthbacteria bacterium]